MLQQLKGNFLFNLAKTLTGNRINSKAIARALQLICTECDFDCGGVYEAINSHVFYLTEEYGLCSPDNPRDDFLQTRFSLQERIQLAQRQLFYLNREAQETEPQQLMLKDYDVGSLVLFPITDGKELMQGYVLLLNFSSKPSLCEDQLNALQLPVSMLMHYTSKRILQKKLDTNWNILESIMDNTGIDIYVNDFHTHDILYVNKSMAEPYGGKTAFFGQKCWQVLFPGQSGPCAFCPKNKILDKNGQPSHTYTWDYQRPFDGSWFRVFSSAFYWDDGRLAHIISSANITENKQNEVLIEKLANYDQLTKLPNRRMLLNECTRRIDKATEKEKGYVLFFDIDGFKSINDTLGHDAGDDFLIQLGEFFSAIPLLENSIYRNGGDEFVAILGGESVTKGNIISLARFIHERFKKPWQLKNGSVQCNTSIGVACYPEDGVTADALLQKADQAMYRVKKSGGGSICFGYQLNEPS